MVVLSSFAVAVHAQQSESVHQFELSAAGNPGPTIGMYQLPKGLTLNPATLWVLRSLGFTSVPYPGPQLNDPSLFEYAGSLGMKLEVMEAYSRSKIDWLAANVAPYPERMRGLGLFVGPDEPNPNSHPVGSAAYNAMIDVLRYAKQRIPSMQRMVNLSAYAATNPAQLWATYAAPYLIEADVVGMDYYAYYWDPNRDPNVNVRFIKNIIPYVGGKPILWFMEGGPVMGTLNEPEVPTLWMVDCFNAVKGAGASYINLYFHYGAFVSASNSVTFGDSQWNKMEDFMLQVTENDLDINRDGSIDVRDQLLVDGEKRENISQILVSNRTYTGS